MIPAGPTSGSPGVPLLFGLPTREAHLAAQDSKLALAGCLPPSRYSPNWQCPQHHQWHYGSDSDWQAQILSILKVYGYDPGDE